MADETSAVAKILERLAGIDAKLDAQAERVADFWDRDWPRVEKELADHERRIRTLEGIMSDIPTLRADMRRLTEALKAEATKTDDLERFRTRVGAYWVATVGIAGLVASIAFWILERLVLPVFTG